MTRNEIIEAFENTKHFNISYWTKTLKQRAGLLASGLPNPHRAGGYYPDHSTISLEKSLFAAYWSLFESGNVKPGFKCFTTPIPGIAGTIDLKTMNPASLLSIGDFKNTGFANLYFESDREVLADETTVIVSLKSASWNVVTFFPGTPIQGRKIPLKQMIKKEISVHHAINMGFTHAKLIELSIKKD